MQTLGLQALLRLDGRYQHLPSTTLGWAVVSACSAALCDSSGRRSAELTTAAAASSSSSSSSRVQQQPVDALVRCLPRWYDAANTPDAALAVLCMAYGSALYVYCGESSADAAVNVRLLLTVDSALKLMRAASIWSTLTGLASPNARVKRCERCWLNAGTHDLMFSGHTSFGSLLMVFAGELAWRRANADGSINSSAVSVLVTCAAVCAALGNGLLQVVVGDHWTVDVLVAYFVTVPWALLALRW
jgi:hypothetical protein